MPETKTPACTTAQAALCAAAMLGFTAVSAGGVYMVVKSALQAGGEEFSRIMPNAAHRFTGATGALQPPYPR